MSFPGGGGSVGDAYIRILADGSNLDDSVRKEFAKHDNAFKEAGRDNSVSYNKGFHEEVTRGNKQSFGKLLSNLRNQRGGFEATGALLGGAFGKEVFKAIDIALGPSKNKDLSHRIFANFSNDALRNGVEPALNRLKDFRTAVTRATDDIVRAEGLLDKKASGFFVRSERNLSKLEQGTKNFDRLIVKNADNFGKLFGKGSRNNFLNFIGSNVANVVKLTRVLPRLGAGFAEVGAELGQARRQGDGFFRTTGRIADVLIQNFVGAVGIGAVAVGGLVGALGAFFVIGAPLAAAISAVAAAVVALSSSIAFGLVGALGALLPILVPIVAGFGIFALAVTKLDKNTKKALSNSLRPLTNEFRALQKVAQVSLLSDVPKQAKLLAPVIRELKPLVAGISGAIRQNISGFIIALRSKGFTQFIATMQTFLPTAVRKLGIIFQNVFTGMAGLFRALSPFALALLDNIKLIVENFSKFTNSAKGQNKIHDFIGKALVSTGKLWTLFKDLGKVVGALFSAGRGPGNSFLDSINSSLERFAKFLNTDKGKKALATFFDNARTAFGFLGKALDGVFKLFGALNGPEGQKILHGIFEAIGKIASTIADLLPSIVSIFKTLFKLAKPVFEALGGLLKFFGEHASAVKATAVAFVTIAAALKLIQLSTKLNALSQLSQFANTKFGAAAGGLSRLTSSLSGFLLAAGIGATAGQLLPHNTEGLIGSILFGAAGGAAVAGPWGAAIGAVAGLVSHFFGGAKKESQEAKEATQDYFNVFSSGADDINKALTAQIALRVSSAKIGDAANKLMIPLTDVTLSIAGNAAATERLQTAFANYIKTAGPDGLAKIAPLLNFLKQEGIGLDNAKTKLQDLENATPGFKDKVGALVVTVTNLGRAWQGIPPKKDLTIVTNADQAALEIQKVIDALAQVLNKAVVNIDVHGHAGRPTAAGAIVHSMRNFGSRLIGEQASEAIVPLNRPLGEVDPSVRWLSALAQGKSNVNGQGKVFNNDITVISPNADPRAVAQELLNTMVAQVNF